MSRVVYMTERLPTKGLTALTPGIDCDEATMGFPQVSYAVFPTADSFWYNVGVS
jgi:hypothetical protein